MASKNVINAFLFNKIGNCANICTPN